MRARVFLPTQIHERCAVRDTCYKILFAPARDQAKFRLRHVVRVALVNNVTTRWRKALTWLAIVWTFMRIADLTGQSLPDPLGWRSELLRTAHNHSAQ